MSFLILINDLNDLSCYVANKTLGHLELEYVVSPM